ncbi:hypothetical protein SDC9_17714 [bioreactor metagenome]|uniref:Helicase ATP-binding domain-containing protein n=1 Tax=bioreactor metagenome TaxID=1076179 RepID=A0A644TY91_9ZZZZ|nr:strawberry notch C-terminal domain-containing protein [Lentimicrobium sp.]MEA5111648.1 strawberry notch C-terminal domain-containing protein [Lentimicrobium sp.]
MKLNQIQRQIDRFEDLLRFYKSKGQQIPAFVMNNLNYYNELYNIATGGTEQFEETEISGIGAPYIPASRGPRLRVEVPDKMNDETHDLLDRVSSELSDITGSGGVDEYVRKKLGFRTIAEMYTDKDTYRGLSAEQIDAIALAIYNIEEKNQMMIVSDQTGIGKGRIAAAIMRYAKQIGKKPIFVTIRANLFTDIYRDLFDVYMDDLVPVKELDKDADGKPKYRIRRIVDEETGEVTEKKYETYKPVKNPKFKRRFVPFILNNKGADDPSVKTMNGDIAYEVKSGKPRIDELEQVIEKHNYKGYDCFLMTYSQFKTGDEKKIEFLRNIVKDNIIILDESHEAGGISSTTGIVFRDILNNYSPLGGLFLSATFAKNPDNMPIYAATTSIKYANLKSEDFVFAIKKGGNALQEIISAELAASGCFIRRERPLSNVTFNYITLDSSGAETFGVPNKEVEHCAIFDNITTALKSIINFQTNFVNPAVAEKNPPEEKGNKTTKKGEEAVRYKASPIFSTLFQIVNQAVFALKAEEVANRAIQRMKEGMKPVITFENTMDTWMDKLVEAYGENNTVNTDFSIVIKRALAAALEYTEEIFIEVEEETGTDENGNPKKETKRVKTSIKKTIDPEEELPKAGKEMYYEILDRINEISFGISIAPIDIIKTKITEAGFTVGEITGRKQEVVFTDGNHTKGRIRARSKENTNSIVFQFQTNRIDAVLLNQAGSTGISLHAQVKAPHVDIIHAYPPNSLKNRKEVKKRVMIVCQPNLDINKMVQTWGRVNRSGQAYKPEYDFITLAVPAETRLMLFLQRKLRSLDANTTSNQKQNETVLNLEDFMNKYGDEMVENWLKENPDLDEEMYEPLWKKASFHNKDRWDETRTDENNKVTHYYDPVDAAMVVSGRVALLKTDDQRKFYNEVNENYKSYITRLKNEGRYDLEVEDMPLNAVTLNKKELYSGEDNDNPFAASTYIEEVEVDVLSKPFNKAELENAVYSTLDGKSVDDFTAYWINDATAFFDRKIVDLRQGIRDKWEKKIADIVTKIKIKKILEEEGREAWQKAVNEMTRGFERDRDEEESIKVGNLKAAKDDVIKYFKWFKPGEGYILKTGEKATNKDGEIVDVTIKSVFLGIDIDESKPNPYANSNMRFRFATCQGGKFRDYYPTPKGGKEVIENTHKATQYYDYSTDFRSQWDTLIRTESSDREIRYIVTGNLLRAYKGEAIGQLISFTYANGKTKKGMLMNKNYQLDMYTNVPLIYAKRLIENLERGSNGRISTNTRTKNSETIDGITFQRNYSGDYTVTVANTAKSGAKYYKNQSLIRLTSDPYSGFKQGNGGTMYAYLPEENLTAFLEVMHKEFNPYETIKLTAAQLEVIKDDMPHRSNSEKSEKTLPKLIKFEAKYINEMKNVAGISGPGDGLTDEEKKIVERLKKLAQKGKKGNLGKTPGNLDSIAKKYKIDLDNLNI